MFGQKSKRNTIQIKDGGKLMSTLLAGSHRPDAPNPQLKERDEEFDKLLDEQHVKGKINTDKRTVKQDYVKMQQDF